MQNNGCKELAYFSNKYFSSKQIFKTICLVLLQKQMLMFNLLIYVLFKDYKRNSLDTVVKATLPIVRNFYIFSQIVNKTFRLSNVRDWKSFKIKNHSLRQKKDFLQLMTPELPNSLQTGHKAQSGNIEDLSKGKMTATSVSVCCLCLTCKAIP